MTTTRTWLAPATPAESIDSELGVCGTTAVPEAVD